jgi:hypothetical protein
MILSATKDRPEWLNIMSKFPDKYNDIYFHPDYISLNCKNDDVKGFLFCNKKDDKVWVNPFIKIKSPTFNNLNNNKEYYDIESAYGYGGPISNILDPIFIKESIEKFHSWAKSNNIISEFLRFHPLYDINQYISPECKILKNRTTCSLDLSLVNEKNLSPFKSKVKNMIKKAQQSIKAYISHDKKDFNNFKKFYLNSMINKNAEKDNLFSSSYFEKLFKIILENGFMSVAKNKDSEIISVAIFLFGKKFCHYHLSASKNHDYPGVNNLIIYNAALYAKKKQLDVLHLGGGKIDNNQDKLFRFKNSMSTSNHNYYIGQRIYDLKIYKRLKILWKKKNPLLYDKYSNRLLCYHINT